MNNLIDFSMNLDLIPVLSVTKIDPEIDEIQQDQVGCASDE